MLGLKRLKFLFKLSKKGTLPLFRKDRNNKFPKGKGNFRFSMNCSGRISIIFLSSKGVPYVR